MTRGPEDPFLQERRRQLRALLYLAAAALVFLALRAHPFHTGWWRP